MNSNILPLYVDASLSNQVVFRHPVRGEMRMTAYSLDPESLQQLGQIVQGEWKSDMAGASAHTSQTLHDQHQQAKEAEIQRLIAVLQEQERTGDKSLVISSPPYLVDIARERLARK